MSSFKKTVNLALTLVAIGAANAGAQVATFDDLPNGSLVPNGYAVPGMAWYNWYVVTDGTYNNTGCSVSASNCVYNGFGGLNSLFEAPTPFKFNGGYFSAWFNTAGGGYGKDVTLTINGWNGGTLVGSNTFLLAGGATPQLLSLNYSNVNLVTFDTHSATNSPNWYLADNLMFNDATLATPEPASMTLLGTGLVGLVGVARRFRKGKAA